MRKSYRDDNGEKIYRYSIRKYHFGAASVAVAALMFFANGVAAQEAPAVSPATASNVVAGPSGNSDGDPENSAEENSKQALPDQPEGKPAGELKAQGAKAEEANQEQKLDKSKPDSGGQESPQGGEVKEQEQPTTADRKAAKLTQGTLKALLKNLTLDSMKALHDEVEARLAAAKAVLDDPNATQAQVDEQVRLMEDLISRVNKVLSEHSSKVKITPKEKLEKLSQSLNTYFKFASEITRPETKELIKGTEDIIRSVNEGLQQPNLTDEKIQSLIEQGEQAERKLGLAVTRENSGARNILNNNPMKSGVDFRDAPTALNTKRAYIVQKGDGTDLPAETYLYSTRRSTIDKLYTPDKEVTVEEALKEAKITVKKDPSDENGYIWTVTFNTHNKDHQNALYWFTLPKGHRMGDVLGVTRTTKGSKSYGGVPLNSEWRGKIKEHLGAPEADYGDAKNHHFTSGFDSVTDVTDNNFIIGTIQRNQANPEATQSSSSYYYMGPAFHKYTRQPIWDTAPSSDVKNKAKRNLAGLKENTDQLYYLKYDGAGIVTISYKTTTDSKYAPLYYGAGMRSYEYSSGKQYFMVRGLQEKPNAPEISDNNVGTVTIKPNTEKADKVEINYVGSDASAKKATLTRNAQNGTWSSDDSGIEVSGTSFIVKPSAVKVGTQVKAKSWFGNSDPSDEATGNILRRTDKPTVTAKEDGSVIVRPSANATHLTISYTDETSKQTKTITADKTGSSWGLKGDSAITISGNTGEITIPANSVADSTKVEAQAKASGEALSEKAEATAKNQDRTAPTIRVRKNGTTAWLTPDSTGKVVVVATPDRNNVELDVDIKDEPNGSGYEFSSNGTNPTATRTVENSTDYNENSTTYSAYGKATDATAKLTVGLKAGKTTTDFSGITMKLNAKDKAGNITNATNKKEVTVKIVSAKPNYPSRVNVLNPTNIKDPEKDRILTAIKEANKTNEAHPIFTKGTDGIITTYTDGTTYTVPYSDVITYDYVAKKKTINVGENPNWGSPKQYFTYGDGSAIGDDKTFLWKDSSNPMTEPNNPDLTVGTNKTVEVLAPNPEGGTPKTLTLTYDVVDTKPPQVKINGTELGENVDQNPRFVIYRGAEFNPTFEVEDNSGKTTYLKASGIPSGVWFNKQGGSDVEKTDLTNNNNQYTLTSNNIVDNYNTLGEHTASVTVKDASNTKTYQFKYVIVDVEARNTPETVPLNTKLVDPKDTGHAKDSHNYVKVSDGNAQKPNGDDNYYATGMTFTWSKDNAAVTNKTLLSTPGVVEYTAVVTFPNNGAKYSKTVDGKNVTIYPPKKDTVPVTFKVQPTAPTVNPDNNGDVRVGHTNETNVSRMEVTYTPADKNRLEDNGNVTKTPQERTRVIATKGTDNQWRITSGGKDGISISINATTGEITLKDQVVKDRTSVEAKVIAQDIESDVARRDSKNGESTAPVIGANSTLVKVGEEFSLPLGLTDAGVGVDDTNIKVSLPNGETGLTYDSTNKLIRGTISAAAKKEITVRVLDKNGNKAEKTIYIAAVKAKSIYAIKDGTIPNVDTPSNFVEVPEGVTLTAAWKNNDRPSTATVGTTHKTVMVSLNGSSVDLTIPVTVYPKAEAKKDKFTTLLNNALPEGEDASSYVHFKDQENKIVNKPTDGVTVAWVTRPSTSVQTDATGNNTKRSVRVTYSVTNADGTVGSVEEIIDINLKVYHATPTITHVTTTFGTDFGGTSNNAQTYFTSNSPKTSSAWKSTSNASYSEYAAYSRTSERQKANYLGKYKDGIQVFMAGDNDAINWDRSEKFDVTFEVKPVTPTVEGATIGATSLTVNNVNSGTTVELYDVTDTTKAPVKIGEKVVNKEGNYDKKDNISVPLTQSLAVGRKIIAKVVYTSGSDRTESDNSNEIVIKYPKPAAPTISQWQNGNVKITPDSTNSGDKITIPLKSGSVVVTKDAQNGWQVTGQPNGVSVHNGSIEIPRNLVNTTVTATASKGEGDVGAVSNEGTHTLTTHAVTKVDIIKKPTDTIAKADLSGTTGITGVTDNNVNKAYVNAEITSVGFTNGKPTLTPDSEQNVSVTITYNDGSKETTTVTLKVAPAAPNVTVNAQDKTTGDVTLTIKRHDNSNYPNDSVVTVHGIDGTFKVKDGTITIKNNQLKDTVQTGKVTVTEKTKLPAETSDDKNIPAKMVASEAPTLTKQGEQDPTTGAVTYKVTKPGGGEYPQNSKVTLNGHDYTVGAGGLITVPNDHLPESKGNHVPTATETGKLPTDGTAVEVPAKMVASEAPTLTKQGEQDPTTGAVTYKVTKPGGGEYPQNSKVTLNGHDYTVGAGGLITVPNDHLPESKGNHVPTATETGKLPTDGTAVEVPAKMVASEAPTLTKQGEQDPTTGAVTYKVTKPGGGEYPQNSKVTLNGHDYTVGAGGLITVPNDHLPESKGNHVPTATETGKLPTDGTAVEVPAKMVASEAPTLTKQGEQDPTTGAVTYKVTKPGGGEYPQNSKVTLNGHDYTVGAGGLITVPNDHLPESKGNHVPTATETGKLPTDGTAVEVPAKMVASEAPTLTKQGEQDPTTGAVTYKVTKPGGGEYPQNSKVTLNGHDYTVGAGGLITVPNDHLPESKGNHVPTATETGKLPTDGTAVEVPAKMVASEAPTLTKQGEQDPTTGAVTYKVTKPGGGEYPQNSKVTLNGHDYTVGAGGLITVPNDHLPESKGNHVPTATETGKLPTDGTAVEVPAKMVASEAPTLTKQGEQDPTTGAVTYKVTKPGGGEYPQNSKVTLNGHDYTVGAGGLITVPNDHLPESKGNHVPTATETGKLPTDGTAVEVPAKMVASEAPTLTKQGEQDPTTGAVTYKVTKPGGGEYPQNSKVTLNGHDYTVGAGGLITVPNDHLPESKGNHVPTATETGKLPTDGTAVEVPAKMVASEAPTLTKQGEQDPTTGAVTYKVTKPGGGEYPQNSKVTLNGHDYTVGAGGLITVPNDHLPESKGNHVPTATETGKLPTDGTAVEVPAKMVASEAPTLTKQGEQDPTTGAVTYKVTKPGGGEYPQNSKVTLNGHDYTVGAGGLITVPNDHLPESKGNHVPTATETGKLPTDGTAVEVPAKMVASEAPTLTKQGEQDPTTGAVTYKVTKPGGGEYPQNSKVTLNGHDYTVGAGGLITVPNDHLPESKGNHVPTATETGKLPTDGTAVEVPAKMVASEAPTLTKQGEQDPTTGAVTYKVTKPGGGEYPQNSKVTLNGHDYTVGAGGLITVPNDHLPESKGNHVPTATETGKLPTDGTAVEVPAKMVASEAPTLTKQGEQDPTTGAVTYKVTKPGGGEYPQNSKVTLNGHDYTVGAGGLITVPNDHLPESKGNHVPTATETGKLPTDGTAVEVPAKMVASEAPTLTKQGEQDPTTGAVTYKVTKPGGGEYPQNSKVTLNGHDYTVGAGGLITVPNDHLPESKGNHVPTATETGKLPTDGTAVEVPAKMVASEAPTLTKQGEQDPTTGAVTYKVTKPGGGEYPQNSKVTLNGHDYTVGAGGLITVPNDHLPESKGNHVPTATETGKLPTDGTAVEVPAKMVASEAPTLTKQGEQDPTTGAVTYKVTKPGGGEYPQNSKVTLNGHDYTVGAGGLITVPNDHLPESKGNHVPTATETGKLPTDGTAVEVPAKMVASEAPTLTKQGEQDPTTGAVTYKVTKPGGGEYPQNSKVTLNGHDYTVGAGGLITVPNDHLPESKGNHVPTATETGKLPTDGTAVEVPAKMVASEAPTLTKQGEQDPTTGAVTYKVTKPGGGEYPQNSKVTLNGHDYTVGAGGLITVPNDHLPESKGNHVPTATETGKLPTDGTAVEVPAKMVASEAPTLTKQGEQDPTTGAVTYKVTKPGGGEYPQNSKVTLNGHDYTVGAGGLITVPNDHLPESKGNHVPTATETGKLPTDGTAVEVPAKMVASEAPTLTKQGEQDPTTGAVTYKVTKPGGGEYPQNSKVTLNGHDYTVGAGGLITVPNDHLPESKGNHVPTATETGKLPTDGTAVEVPAKMVASEAPTLTKQGEQDPTTGAVTYKVTKPGGGEYPQNSKVTLNGHDYTVGAGGLITVPNDHLPESKGNHVPTATETGKLPTDGTAVEVPAKMVASEAPTLTKQGEQDPTTGAVTYKVTKPGGGEYPQNSKVTLNGHDYTVGAGGLITVPNDHLPESKGNHVPTATETGKLPTDGTAVEVPAKMVASEAPTLTKQGEQDPTTGAVTYKVTKPGGGEYPQNSKVTLNGHDYTVGAGGLITVPNDHLPESKGNHVPTATETGKLPTDGTAVEVPAKMVASEAPTLTKQGEQDPTTGAVTYKVTKPGGGEYPQNSKVTLNGHDYTVGAGGLITVPNDHLPESKGNHVPTATETGKLPTDGTAVEVPAKMVASEAPTLTKQGEQDPTTGAVTYKVTKPGGGEYPQNSKVTLNGHDYTVGAGGLITVPNDHLPESKGNHVPTATETGKLPTDGTAVEVPAKMVASEAPTLTKQGEQDPTTGAVTYKVTKPGGGEYPQNSKVTLNGHDYTVGAGGLITVPNDHLPESKGNHVPTATETGKLPTDGTAVEVPAKMVASEAPTLTKQGEQDPTTGAVTYKVTKPGGGEYPQNSKVTLNGHDYTVGAGGLITVPNDHLPESKGNHVPTATETGKLPTDGTAVEVPAKMVASEAPTLTKQGEQDPTTGAVTYKVTKPGGGEYPQNSKVTLNGHDYTVGAGGLITVPNDHLPESKGNHVPTATETGKLPTDGTAVEVPAKMVASEAPTLTKQGEQDPTTGAVTYKVTKPGGGEYPQNSKVTLNGHDYTVGAGGLITVPNDHLPESKGNHVPTATETGKLPTDGTAVEVPAKMVASEAPTLTKQGEQDPTTGAVTYKVTKPGGGEYPQNSKVTLNGHDYTVGAGGLITVPNDHLPESKGNHVPTATETGKLPTDGTAVEVPAKMVASEAPTLTKQGEQDPTTGAVTYKVTKPGGGEYPQNSKVTLNGHDYTVGAGGLITVPNDHLPESKGNHVPTATETGKLPTDGTAVEVPAKMVASEAPTLTKQGEQDPTTGAVTYKVTKPGGGEYPQNSKVTLNGHDYTVGAGGLITVPNDHLPESKGNHVPTATETGKLPTDGTAVEVPAKMVASEAPTLTKQGEQDPTTGAVTYKVTKPGGGEYPQNSKVTLNGHDYTVGAGGLITVPNDHLPESKGNHVPTATETGKLPTDGTAVEVPAKMVASEAPTLTKQGEQDPTTGAVTYKVTKPGGGEYPQNSKVTLNGHDYTVGAGGLITVPNDHLPESKGNHVPTATETGKLPTDGTAVEVPAKMVASEAPTLTKQGEQDPTTGAVTYKVTKPGGGEYPQNSKVTLNGHDYTVGAGGLITVPNDHLPESKGNHVPTATETGKLPTDGTAVEVPAKMVASEAPTLTKQGEQDPTTGAVTYKVTKPGGGEYPQNSKVTLNGHDYTVGAGGLITVPNDHLPESKGNHVPTATETGKLPTDGTAVEVPAKMVASEAPTLTKQGEQDPATPSDDTNPRPDTATPAEVPAAQPAGQPSQTVEVPAQLPNEVSETNPSVSQPQAVLPNTGTQEDRATGALGVLSLLGAFGLLFAKKKKDDEEEA